VDLEFKKNGRIRADVIRTKEPRISNPLSYLLSTPLCDIGGERTTDLLVGEGAL